MNRQARRANPAATVARIGPAAPPELDAEWRRWLAENLLLGATPDEMAVALAQRGCPADIAQGEIAAALAHPYFRAADVLRARLAKRDWHLGLAPRHAALAPEPEALAPTPAMSGAFLLARHYAPQRPALIRGMIDHWPARRWTIERLAALPGDPEIELQSGRAADPNYESGADHHVGRMRLSAFVALLQGGEAGNDVYLTARNSSANRAALAPLWAEIGELPGILQPDPGREALLWVGPRGTVTPWHHDLTNNLLVQIAGRKRVHIVPSAETPLMRNHLHCYSAYGGDAALRGAPAGARPRVITAMLEPGDALFLPVGWWHHVEGLETSFSLSFTNFVWPNDMHQTYATYGQV